MIKYIYIYTKYLKSVFLNRLLLFYKVNSNAGASCIFIILSLCFTKTFSQFNPPAGQQGTSAIYKDSNIFVSWATGCIINRGFQDISVPSLGYTTAGDNSGGIGKAGESGVVSLGDGGSAVLTFSKPITDGPGYDFAVFENSFNDSFLELAFVEVSSDGIHFYRFPATSYTQYTSQIGGFDTLNACLINNLAGKYRAFYGTPFDLQELEGIAELDITHIIAVKIVDVVGSINANYATYDYNGNIINDPWPTPFPSGGFDLDAIGVINQDDDAGITNFKITNAYFNIYPTLLAQDKRVNIIHKSGYPVKANVNIINNNGNISRSFNIYENNTVVELDGLTAGVYTINIISENRRQNCKVVVTETK